MVNDDGGLLTCEGYEALMLLICFKCLHVMFHDAGLPIQAHLIAGSSPLSCVLDGQ